MSTAAPWSPEYERLGVHFSSCPICRAVDGQGASLNQPCEEGQRLSEDHRTARAAARARS